MTAFHPRQPVPCFRRPRGLLLLLAMPLALLAVTAIAAAPANSDLLKRGEYLTRAADCAACHTVDADEPFAGGYPLHTPFGVIYGPNITPDKATGIGDWSDDEFVRALRQGIGRHGENLYPAFPYTAFTKLSRKDILVIKAYLFSQTPIHHQVPDNALSFPFKQRWLLAGWKWINFKPGRFQPQADKSPAWNRGAYLTEALGHCQACHTPRNLTFGLDESQAFGGAQLAGWRAFNITPDKSSGIGGWTDDELVQYFHNGRVPNKASVAGGMAEAVQHSLRYLNDDDLRAIVTYLRTVKPIHRKGDDKPRYAVGQPAHYEAALRGVAPVSGDNRAHSPQELYSGFCASCHGADGKGSPDHHYPALFHNTTVGARTPDNLVMVILHGVRREGAEDEAFMPGFAHHLTDVQVAQLSTYLLQQFGAGSRQVSADEVAELRQDSSGYPW